MIRAALLLQWNTLRKHPGREDDSPPGCFYSGHFCISVLWIADNLSIFFPGFYPRFLSCRGLDKYLPARYNLNLKIIFKFKWEAA